MKCCCQQAGSVALAWILLTRTLCVCVCGARGGCAVSFARLQHPLPSAPTSHKPSTICQNETFAFVTGPLCFRPFST
jgi:hypothetical protein